jgi:hypothetical protein
MAETELLDPQTTGELVDEPESSQEAAGEDLGEWNELLPDELKEQLKRLAQFFCDEFRYPRRLEVMMAWKARCFWREMQHLSWNWENEAWECLGPAGTRSGTQAEKYDSAVLYSTNLFQGFGESYIAILTQSVPNVRFEPEDPDEAADIETARCSDSYRKIIQHENDPIKLLTKAAYYSWTDGRIHGWTCWAVDKRTGQPRETQRVFGAMEVKVPVTCDEQSEFVYLQYSDEYHVATVRQKVKGRNFEDPEYWKKVRGGSSGNGQDMYERTARISVKQGISMRSAGGDAYAHLVTTQRTWMRPEAFLCECVEEKFQAQLQQLFPSGCYCEFDNGVYTGSRDANMDDEWTVENIMEGDGQYRNAKGSCLLSVQERANDTINTAQDVYEKTQPASHWDDKLFDLDGMRRQRSMPGARYGVDVSQLQPGDTVAGHVFFEPAAAVSADMLQYLKELMTDIPEFLTGISAILFGSDSGGDKSGKALSIQQNAAMGRIGLPWRTIKRFYANMMEQAVRCGARNRKADVKQGIPDGKGNIETIQVRIEDMKGSVRCYADADENFPESWTAKRATYMQLMQESAQNPAMAQTLLLPKNQELGKKFIGLSEFELPGADSWNKQMQEINILLTAPPTPVQPPPMQVPNPLAPGVMETIQPPPTLQSTVPIDKDYDVHMAEFQTVQDWINSAPGQRAKTENPEGFANVRQHGLEHKQAMAPPPIPGAGGPGIPPAPMPPAAAHPAAPPPAMAG